jgi:hypothetical protein
MLVDEATEQGHLPGEIASAFHYVRVLGNKVRHGSLRTRLTLFDAENCLRMTYRVLVWYLSETASGPQTQDLTSPDMDETNQSRMPFAEFLALITRLIEADPIKRQVLILLAHGGRSTVDTMTKELNLSRMVIIQSAADLLEVELVRWESPGSDALVLNDRIYNIRYVVAKALGL